MSGSGKTVGALPCVMRSISELAREAAQEVETTSCDVADGLRELGSKSAKLIVKLQTFDRVCQELVALAGVIDRCATLVLPVASAETELEEALASVNLSHIRNRLLGASQVVSATGLSELQDGDVF